jgi:undecaprenyl-diphosphatase
MNYLHILILAVIQGAAELLPVSSSAHVIVTAKLLGINPGTAEFHFLLVMLHTGTMFAVIVYFWPRWKSLLFAPPGAAGAPMSWPRFVLMIVVATACTGVIGLGLKELIEKVILGKIMGRDKAEIEDLFQSLPLMAASLFTVGVFILIAGRRENGAAVRTVDGRSAVWIGIVQGLCLPFRGFSRSGATISTALVRGVERSLAEDFSFALAVVLTPPIIGRELYRVLKKTNPDLHAMDLLLLKKVSFDAHLLDLLTPGLVGMVFSFLAGLVALKLLSAVLENGRWGYFGVYCLLASLGVVAAAWAGL